MAERVPGYYIGPPWHDTEKGAPGKQDRYKPEAPAMTPQQMSIADMYPGIYPSATPNVTAEGLNIRNVTTKDIVIGPNGFPVAQAPKKSGTQYFTDPDNEGFNTVTQQYETKQPGNGYTYIPGPAKKPNSAIDAINTNTGLQASLLSKGIAGHNRYMSSISDMFGSGGANPGDTGMFGIPMSDGMAQILATDPKYRAPAGAAPTRWKAAPAAAPAPAGNLLTTLADMVSGVSAPPPTYTTTPFQQENFQTTAGAQMPSSMNNSRWTTGY